MIILKKHEKFTMESIKEEIVKEERSTDDIEKDTPNKARDINK